VRWSALKKGLKAKKMSLMLLAGLSLTRAVTILLKSVYCFVKWNIYSMHQLYYMSMGETTFTYVGYDGKNIDLYPRLCLTFSWIMQANILKFTGINPLRKLLRKSWSVNSLLFYPWLWNYTYVLESIRNENNCPELSL